MQPFCFDVPGGDVRDEIESDVPGAVPGFLTAHGVHHRSGYLPSLLAGRLSPGGSRGNASDTHGNEKGVSEHATSLEQNRWHVT
jgi:hypothetical protein